jgi:membrane associated rhomboid family serine protease
MVTLGVLLVLIEVVNAADDQRLDRFGLQPRVPSGLVGIVTMPFLHASFGHLMANIFPFLIVGWVVLVGGLRDFAITTLVIMVGGGLATWIVGPDATIVGASALIFGWLGYLVARAVFSRRFMWILVAAGMLLFFGGLFTGLLPSASHDYIAWQAHLCGFIAGGAAGWWLHPRKGTDRYLRVHARVTRP